MARIGPQLMLWEITSIFGNQVLGSRDLAKEHGVKSRAGTENGQF